MERRRLNDQLEDRLQRAKRLRMDYLKLRRKAISHSSAHASSEDVDNGNILSSKLARCWKQFVIEKGTTFSLAKAYIAVGINENSIRLIPFEQLAPLIGSGATIQTTKALLGRIENLITIRQELIGANKPSILENIDHLLKHVISPHKRVNEYRITKFRGDLKVGSGEVGQDLVKLSRYPVRVALCAYMILGHPDAVLTGKGEYEISLANSAKAFIQEFELLIRIILEGLMAKRSSIENTFSSVQSQLSFWSQMESFDKAWCSYLYSFVRWKVKDAKLLEEDLVRAACQLEVKMIQTCKQSSKEDFGDTEPDMKALQEKVIENQKLLQANVQQLIGNAGLEHMEHALSDARSQFIDTKAGPSLASSPAHFSALSSTHLSQEAAIDDSIEAGIEGHPRVGHTQTTDDLSVFSELGSVTPRKTTDSHFNKNQMSVTDNEVLANEIVHGHRSGLVDRLSINVENKNSIKAMVKDTMEKAFWDGVLESINQEEPDYGWVLKLMEEVLDELCEMSPSSWREKIIGTIDIEILSQVLKSGTVDMDYLRGILEFALDILRKLSAPAKENELKTSHQKFLEQINEISQTGERNNASFAVLAIKGLRFVLQQIQSLKHEISNWRISMLEPLIKGPTGLEYLRSAFTNRYGAPSEARASVPLVLQWLSAAMVVSEQDWNDHLDSVSALSSQGLPLTTLRAGGSILKTSTVAPTSTATGAELSECKGEKVDLYLRLGLLRLVSEVEGLKVGKLPETLKLNISRLRAVQSKLQKVIVICCSVLVLRQTILCDQLVTSSTEQENIISKCVNRLLELLDSSEDVGISEIVETINCFSDGDDLDKCQSRTEVMANMLVKSLRAGDPVFECVSRTVYLAARGVVLGGSGIKGRQLAEMVLKRIGAAFLTEKPVEAVEELVHMAYVSACIHRAWYEEVLKNLN